MDFLDGVQAWHWLALGLALLVAELATGSTYLLWPAVAAWISGLLLLFFPLGWPAQLAIFAGATILLTLTGRHYVKGRWLLAKGDAQVNEPVKQVLGAQVVAAQDFVSGFGRVRMSDGEWRAACAEPVKAGDRLEVVGMDGATLQVRPLPPLLPPTDGQA